ncbi:MAG: hypothetical protein M0Z76_09610, partial [Gammaproteobacteria bacterium]|nr:hypothetical protein [Gammaproteobacteria bacterium]
SKSFVSAITATPHWVLWRYFIHDRYPLGIQQRHFYQSGTAVIILLCGGDKTTQDTDITNAKTIAARWKESSHG